MSFSLCFGSRRIRTLPTVTRFFPILLNIGAAFWQIIGKLAEYRPEVVVGGTTIQKSSLLNEYQRQRMNKLTIEILGCGDALASGGSFNTCFFVRGSAYRLLIDCGASSLVAL